MEVPGAMHEYVSTGLFGGSSPASVGHFGTFLTYTL